VEACARAGRPKSEQPFRRVVPADRLGSYAAWIRRMKAEEYIPWDDRQEVRVQFKMRMFRSSHARGHLLEGRPLVLNL